MKRKITFQLDAKQAIIKSSDKLGRHNTTAKAHIHKSKKEYDRKREKRDWRRKMDDDRWSFYFLVNFIEKIMYN